jgi:hypothetical protein
MCHLGSPEQRRSPELSPPTPSACGLHRSRERSDQDFSSDLLRRQVWRGEGQSPARLLVQIRLMPLAEAPPHPAKPRGLGSRCRRRRRDPRAAERAYSDNWGVKRSNHGRGSSERHRPRQPIARDALAVYPTRVARYAFMMIQLRSSAHRTQDLCPAKLVGRQSHHPLRSRTHQTQERIRRATSVHRRSAANCADAATRT